MSNLNKTIQLLRQAANSLEVHIDNKDTTNSAVPVPEVSSQPTSKTSNSISEVRKLFSPYNRPTSCITKTRWVKPSASCGKWAHKFSCISDPGQDYVPNREMKKNLLEAGLGEKRITFDRNNNPIQDKILEIYPRLKSGGGLELLRSLSRYTLELIPPPKCGYHAEYLYDSCSLGQAIVYIRPLQKALDTEPSAEELEVLVPTNVLVIWAIFTNNENKSHTQILATIKKVVL